MASWIFTRPDGIWVDKVTANTGEEAIELAKKQLNMKEDENFPEGTILTGWILGPTQAWEFIDGEWKERLDLEE